MSGQGAIPSTEHFQLQTIAEGVFVAQPKLDGGAGCNAGIIDLGDQTIIFDPFLTPQAAAELLAVAESVTSSPVKLVVNSHHHLDHIGGNQSFPASTAIVSTSLTRELMQTQAVQQLGRKTGCPTGVGAMAFSARGATHLAISLAHHDL
jgi:glyoxylase-like metal-dependent hydrolase (beta-lactamase superfamily II)